MTNEDQNMRAQLLGLEPIEGLSRASYEASLQELFSRKLGRRDRVRYLIPSIAGFVLAVGLGSLALTEPESTPLVTRALLLVLAGVGAFWSVVCTRILMRGSVDLRGDRRRLTSAALAVALLQLLFFGWQSAYADGPVAALIVSAVFVGLAMTAVVLQRLKELVLLAEERRLRAE